MVNDEALTLPISYIVLNIEQTRMPRAYRW